MALGRRLWAVGALGMRALVVHPVQRLVRPGRLRGRGRFLANYAPEGLVPLAPAERAVQPEFMRCIACGLCDQVCPLVGELGRDFRGPAVVALAYTRATPDLAPVAPVLRQLPERCGSCTACVDACPTRVPLRTLFAYARSQLARVEEAAAEGAAPAPAGERTPASPPALPPPAGDEDA